MDTAEQSESVIKTANVFDNDSGVDVSLRAVSTKTSRPDARVKYSVYKLNNNASDPEDGTLLATKASYYEYAGFHREKLEDSITVKAGEKIGVVVEAYVIEDGAKLYEYDVNAAPTKKYSEEEGDPLYCEAVVNEGESFVYENGEWIDFSKYEPRLMLHRMSGEPEGGAAISFADTDADAWYSQAVRWAAAEGVVFGYSDTEFGPDDKVTREQLASILYRYAKTRGKGFDEEWLFPFDFSDVDTISEYAYEPMCWMAVNGIINGMDDGTLSPRNNATRAQIAAMFMRFSAEIEK